MKGFVPNFYVQSAKKERTNELNSRFDKTLKKFSVIKPTIELIYEFFVS